MLSHVQLVETPWLWPGRLLCPWDSSARILEGVAMPFSRGSSWPRDWTWVSWIGRWSLFFFCNWRLITLQYCSGFAIHWHESVMSLHVFPILNIPSHLPPHPIPLGHPSAPALSTLSHASNLDWQFISHMIIYVFQMLFSQIIPPSPSPRVQKSVLYICVYFAVSHIGSLLPSFWIPYIYINILYWCFTSLCIIGPSFIHLIRTDSNAFFS